MEHETTALSEYTFTQATVAALVAKYNGLSVAADDKKSYAAVRSARMDLVHTRTAVEKRRKALGEDALVGHSYGGQQWTS